MWGEPIWKGSLSFDQQLIKFRISGHSSQCVKWVNGERYYKGQRITIKWYKKLIRVQKWWPFQANYTIVLNQ